MLIRNIIAFAAACAAMGFAFAGPAVFTLPSGVEVEFPESSPLYDDFDGNGHDDSRFSRSAVEYLHGNLPVEMTFRNPGPEARHITLELPMRVGPYRIFAGSGPLTMHFKAEVDVPAGGTVLWRPRIPCFGEASFQTYSDDRYWKFFDGVNEARLICTYEGDWGYEAPNAKKSVGVADLDDEPIRAAVSPGVSATLRAALRENYERQMLLRDGMTAKEVEKELARKNRYVRYLIWSKSVPCDAVDDWRDYSAYDVAVLTAGEFAALPEAASKALMGYAASGGAVIVVGAVPEGAGAAFKSRKIAFGEIWFTGEDGIDDWPRFIAFLEESFRRQTLAAQPLLECDVKAKVSVLKHIADTPFLAILAILAAFVVVAGPVSIVILARKNKRINILWLFPLLAVAFSFAVMAVIILANGVIPHVERFKDTARDESTGIEVAIENTVMVAPFPLSKPIRMPSDGLVSYFSGDGRCAGSRIELKGDSFEFSGGWTPILWPVRFRTVRVSFLSQRRSDAE